MLWPHPDPKFGAHFARISLTLFLNDTLYINIWQYQALGSILPGIFTKKVFILYILVWRDLILPQSRAEQRMYNLEWHYYPKVPPTQPHHQMSLFNIELFKTFCHDPGQGRVELYNLEWYYYPKVPTPPPPHHQMSLYNIELFNTYCHNPGQSREELYNLEW